MVEMLISEIKLGMMAELNNGQIEKLDQVLKICLIKFSVTENNNAFFLDNNNDDMLNTFISAKRVEGCSDRTIK